MKFPQLAAFIGVFAVTLAVSATGGSAVAEPLFTRYLAGGSCYQRFYDPQHLRTHPRQTITKFHVRAQRPDPIGRENPRRFSVQFGFWLKDRDGGYSALAVCDAKDAAADCNVEGDGGSFRLTPNGDGLKVTLSGRLEIEGDKDFSPNLADGDNRVMLLPKAGDGETCM